MELIATQEQFRSSDDHFNDISFFFFNSTFWRY